MTQKHVSILYETEANKQTEKMRTSPVSYSDKRGEAEAGNKTYRGVGNTKHPLTSMSSGLLQK